MQTSGSEATAAKSARGHVTCWLAAIAIAALATAPADAAELKLTLKGSFEGQSTPLAQAVVSLHAQGPAASAPPAPPGTPAVMDQHDATFVPDVLAVQTATAVFFPNSDETLHHVYSFSSAKRFELPLYSGHEADPVIFDQPGVVTLGCNIHDWMVAHIVVLETPYYTVSDAEGIARVEAPPGSYRLRVWHARLAEPFVEAAIELPADGAKRDIGLQLAPPPPPLTGGSSRLRALQKALRGAG